MNEKLYINKKFGEAYVHMCFTFKLHKFLIQFYLDQNLLLKLMIQLFQSISFYYFISILVCSQFVCNIYFSQSYTSV